MKKLLVILGGSGVGKTTLERKLNNNGVVSIDIFTTRMKRHDDLPNYHYVEYDELKELEITMPLDYVFTTEINDRSYGYYLPTTDGSYVVSFIEPANAIYMSNMAIKQGFDVTLARFDHDYDIDNAISGRVESQLELENRKRIKDAYLDTSMLSEEVSVIFINRDNALEVCSSI